MALRAAMRLRPGERRALALVALVLAGFYGAFAAIVSVVGLIWSNEDLGWWWGALIAAAAAAFAWASARTVRACARYLRTGAGGRRCGREFALAYVAGVAWGVTVGAYPAAGQVLYSPMIAAALLAAFAVARLVALGRRAHRDRSGAPAAPPEHDRRA